MMNTETKLSTSLYIAWNARTDAFTENITPAPPTPLATYHTVCSKYSDEIRAIQKHFPGWKPAFYPADSQQAIVDGL